MVDFCDFTVSPTHRKKRPRVPRAVPSFSEHINSVLLRCAMQNEASRRGGCCGDRNRPLCCVAILDGLVAGERGGFLWRMCESRNRVRSVSPLVVPDHAQDKPSPTQEATSHQLRPQTPFRCQFARPRASRRSARSSSPCSSHRATRCALCQTAPRPGLALLQRRARATTSLGDRTFS